MAQRSTRPRTGVHWYTVEKLATQGLVDEKIAEHIRLSGIGKPITRQRVHQMRTELGIARPSVYPRQSICKSRRGDLHYFIAMTRQDTHCPDHRVRQIQCAECNNWFGTMGRVDSCRKCRTRQRVKEYYMRKRQQELHHDSSR